jgi:hypothetical protein
MKCKWNVFLIVALASTKRRKKTKSENIHVCNLEYRHNHYQISMKKTDRVQIYFNKKNIHRRRKNLSGAQIKCEY